MVQVLPRTFLDFTNRAIAECGSGVPVLTTCQNQSGEALRFVNWVGDAWRDLQTAHDDWDWMRSSNILGYGISVAPAAGVFNIPLGTGAGQVGVDPTAFGKWDKTTFRNYSTAAGVTSEMFMDEIPYDTWRDSYYFGAMRFQQTRPVAVAIGPDQSINLGPPTNGLYTITADFFMAAQEFVNDTDLPAGVGTNALPQRFGMLIVYGAMQKYADYEAANEVTNRANREYGRLYDQLENARAIPMTWAGALEEQS
jgi:hypothetical protein